MKKWHLVYGAILMVFVLLIASANLGCAERPYQPVKTKHLYYCEQLGITTGSDEKHTLNEWRPETDVVIIGFQIESHVMITGNVQTDRDGSDNLVFCGGYVSLEGELPLENRILRAVTYVFYRNGQWLGRDNNTQQLMFPAGHGIFLDADQPIYLHSLAANKTNKSQGVGTQLVIFYVER